MRNIFTYGTLMCADIMKDVAGYLPAGESAVLKGYGRYRVHGEAYPGMIPDPDKETAGVVYTDVSEAALVRLDDFEGELYERKMVRIRLADDREIEADTYLVKPRYRDRLELSEWSFEAFMDTGKASFTRFYSGYEALSANHPEPNLRDD